MKSMWKGGTLAEALMYLGTLLYNDLYVRDTSQGYQMK